MDTEALWLKIRELAINYYYFAMEKGENRFMIFAIDSKIASKEEIYMFLGSLLVIFLLVIWSCDSFDITFPVTEFFSWKGKVSIFHVLFFAGAVFSFHTFYKMLVILLGGMVSAQASIDALNSIGTYINPISVMIYAYTVSTMKFEKKNGQALFLGLVLFLTPSIMTFKTFTNERIMLSAVGIVLGITGGFLYKRCSPYISYFLMSMVYLVCKFFMLYYSEQILILTTEPLEGKIVQFFVCEQVDLIIIFILLLILFGYKEINTYKKNLKIKRDIFIGCIAVVLLVGSFASNNFAEVHYVSIQKDRQMQNLIGIWYGEYESQLIFKEGGISYYKDGNSKHGGKGTWEITESGYVVVKSSALPYEIYGRLDNGFSLKKIRMEADSENWIDELFQKQ